MPQKLTLEVEPNKDVGKEDAECVPDLSSF